MRRDSILTKPAIVGILALSVIAGCKDSNPDAGRLLEETKDSLRASIRDAERTGDWDDHCRKSYRRPADKRVLQLLESMPPPSLEVPLVYLGIIAPSSSKKDVYRVTVCWLEKGQSTKGMYLQRGDDIIARYEKEDWSLEYDLTNDHFLRMRVIGVFTRPELLLDRPRTLFVPNQMISRNLKVGVICGDGSLSNAIKPYFFDKTRDQLMSIAKIKQMLAHADPDYEYPDYLRPDLQRALDFLESDGQDFSIPRMMYGVMWICNSEHSTRALLVNWLSEEQNVVGFFLEDDQGKTYEIRNVDLSDESTFSRHGLTYECEVVWGDARTRPTNLAKDQQYLKFLKEMSENDLRIGLLKKEGKSESIGLHKDLVDKSVFGD